MNIQSLAIHRAGLLQRVAEAAIKFGNGISASTVRVLITLSAWADINCETTMSVSEIAKHSCVSILTARKSTKILATHGMIEVSCNYDPEDGSTTANTYKVII